jgi:hypothetical protein
MRLGVRINLPPNNTLQPTPLRGPKPGGCFQGCLVPTRIST